MSERPFEKELFEVPKKEKIIKKWHEDVFKFIKLEKDPKTGQEVEKEYIKVGKAELEVNKEGEGTKYKREEFKDFSFDQISLRLLKTLARQIQLDHPIYIEGETDIGKTKAVELLSYLTNNRLYTISLKGTTDPSEFFGKHVPESESLERKVLNEIRKKEGLSTEVKKKINQALEEGRVLNMDEIEKLAEMDVERIEGITKGTQKILEKVSLEGRGLTKEEWIKIGEMEGIPLNGTSFKWQDGELIKQFQHNNGRGSWTYIDEMGAAEPQILVALNRALEQRKRIYLTENAGRMVEGGPETRLIATSNPPEYAGRNPLPPDYLRRWKYEKVGRLTEETLEQRTKFIFNKTSLPKEVSPFLVKATVEFHLLFADQIKSLTKSQRQQTRAEFSDIIRIRDDLDKLWDIEDPIGSLKDSISDYYFGKIGEEDAKEEAQELLDEVLEGVTGSRVDGKTLKEKIEEAARETIMTPEQKKRKIFNEELEKAEKTKQEMRELKEQLFF